MLAHNWHIFASAQGYFIIVGNDLGTMRKFMNSCLDRTMRFRTDGVIQNLQTLVVSSILTSTLAVPRISIDCSFAAHTLDLDSFSSRISACFATLEARMQTSLPVSGHERAIRQESAVFLLDLDGAILISRLSVFENSSETAVSLPLAHACIEDMVFSAVSLLKKYRLPCVSE